MNWESLFQSVQQQSERIILTANQGLARSLLLSYGAYQQSKGLEAWVKPTVLAYQHFVQKWLMNTPLGRSRLMLTSEQCEMVWREIIDEQETGILLDAANTAKQARRAEGLWHDYLLTHTLVKDWESLETQRFMRWRKVFWEKMENQQWWPPEYLMVAVIQAVEAGSELPFKRLTLIGFEEMTPLQKKWVSSLEHRGIDVTFFEPQRQEQVPRVWQLETFEDELKAAAFWAQKKLAQEPKSKLGIVMPGLEVFLPKVEHHLGCVLAPDVILGDAPERPKPFHLSLGKPLLQWRPVLHLFLFWRLLSQKLEIDEIDMVFRSTFMWGSRSLLTRSQFLGLLRQTRKGRLSSFDARRLMSKYRSHKEEGLEPTWADIFCNALDSVKQQPRLAYASYWSQFLNGLAHDIYWLRGKGVDSSLFQLKAAVKTALDDAAKWDIVLGEISLNAFLSHLKRIWQNRLFQPESQNQPIRVLGILEAMGNAFDAIWVCRMNEGVWPPMGHPNPFLPARIQQLQQMPHASVQRELHFAQLALTWLLKSASEVNLSFASQEESLPLTPSPLLKTWMPEHFDLSGVTAFSSLVKQSVHTEHFQDWQGLPYTDEVVKGGTSVLESHLECPCRSYALKRLFVEAPREEEPAVGADQHGELLHATLYEIWGALGEQAQLLKLSENEIEDLTSRTVDTAWEKMKIKLSNTSKIFEVAEKKRVVYHVSEWLKRETSRPPFKVIAREKKYDVSLEDRKLHVKIDRIDKLENGATLCLDYKTGKNVKASDLTQDPLEKVQLPLYALALESPPEVLAYGVINAEKKKLLGAGDVDSLGFVALDNKSKKKNELSWDEQISLWRVFLSETLRDYLKGNALRSKNSKAICEYCDARPVCRVDEELQVEEVTYD